MNGVEVRKRLSDQGVKQVQYLVASPPAGADKALIP